MLKTTIPFIDLRGKTPVDLLRAYPDKAHAVLSASRTAFGGAGYAVSLPALWYSDKRSRRWLERRANPYRHEIESMADIVKKRGTYTLNLSYEWGCTSGAYLTQGNVSLLRVLDFPFPTLGKHVVVALQKGAAGDYFNVTWPALSGMFQGMAPGRFSAAINQAPMRKHGLGFAGDWIKNRFVANKQKGLPPAHLLRNVFDTAKNYEEAKEMLITAPIAMPAIFILSGLKEGQGCVIERLENKAEIKELSAAQKVTAANEFCSNIGAQEKGWRAREIDSPGRYHQSETITAYDLAQDDFNWLRPPMLNQFTRLVMLSDAKKGTLMVQGYEGQGAVTEVFATQTAA